MISKVSKDVISTGIKGVGQDYLGAVKGALSVGMDLTYPVCADMSANGLYTAYDPWYDERLWYFPGWAEGGYESHFYGDYDRYLLGQLHYYDDPHFLR